jgi:hypothetical protein
LFGTLFHFLHDIFGGWGIKLLFPFSWKNYRLFGKKFGQFYIVATWTKEEIARDIDTTYHGKD